MNRREMLRSMIYVPLLVMAAPAGAEITPAVRDAMRRIYTECTQDGQPL